MSYSQLILRDSAEIVWPLDDITESSSFSSAINFLSPTASAYDALININNCIVENIPMVYGGNTSLKLTSPSVCFSIPAMGRFSDLYKDKNSVLTFWLKIDDFSLEERPLFKRRGYDYCGLFIKENYLIFKFGTQEDHSIIIGELINPEEPHLISLVISPSYRSMSIDGLVSNILVSSDNFPEFNQDFTNDYLDFYGPSNNSWTVDCPAFYTNIIDDSNIKRQYVYGLGKWMPYDIFFNRGGTLYNFTTIATERNASYSWDFAEEWRLSDYEDLIREGPILQSIKFNPPSLYSFDNNISFINNEINFSSPSATVLSYIDVEKIQEKITDKHGFFIKFKLPEEIIEDIPQRLVSISNIPDVDYLNINLLSTSGSLQVIFICPQTNDELFINLTNTSYNEYFYVGFKFIENSSFYVVESNSVIQTASFNFINEDGYGQDPLVLYYPFNNLTTLRIGATSTFNLKTDSLLEPFEINQFNGSFVCFKTIRLEDIENIDGIDYLDNYIKTKYSFRYLSDEKRFKVSTYGFGHFYIHAIDIASYLSDLDQRLDGNLVNIGYPDIPSSSAVEFYVTQETYSGSVVTPTIKLSSRNSLPFINNKNINGTRLKFNFSIYSDDRIYYPPGINYFKFESYGNGDGKAKVRDEGAPPFYIYPNSSSNIYLPETTWTPNVFITNYSGIKSSGNVIDFSPDIPSIPLNPLDIDGLILWLDARSPNGTRKSLPQDDSRLTFWEDLSGNSNHATASISSAPIYRLQSLNIFTLNQLTGSDFGSLDFIQAYNSTLESSIQSISGPRSISIIPNGSSTNSYIEFSNSASISTFPNQEYTVVGSIKLNRRQTASALNEFSRKIVVLNDNGSGLELVSESSSVSNSAGIYSASLKFSTSSATLSSAIRFYNGSFSSDDVVYWDNLGLYPVSSSMVDASGGTASIQNIINNWIPPLSSNDSPTVKFNGESSFITSSASVSGDYTMYVVARVFNDSAIISSSSFSLSVIDNDIKVSGQTALVQANNLFNIYTIIKNNIGTKVIVNGLGYGITDSNIINYLNIGKGINNNYLSGDISAILLYSGEHDYKTRSAIENFLDESFNLSQTVIGLTELNDAYTDSYSRLYLNN